MRAPDKHSIVFERFNDTERVLAVFSNSREAMTVKDLPAGTYTDLISGERVTVEGTYSLEPFGFVLLKAEEQGK